MSSCLDLTQIKLVIEKLFKQNTPNLSMSISNSTLVRSMELIDMTLIESVIKNSKSQVSRSMTPSCLEMLANTSLVLPGKSTNTNCTMLNRSVNDKRRAENGTAADISYKEKVLRWHWLRVAKNRSSGETNRPLILDWSSTNGSNRRSDDRASAM